MRSTQQSTRSAVASLSRDASEDAKQSPALERLEAIHALAGEVDELRVAVQGALERDPVNPAPVRALLDRIAVCADAIETLAFTEHPLKAADVGAAFGTVRPVAWAGA